MKLDQHDFVLVCADENLHIIELKRPDAKLIEEHLSHYIVSSDVHKAVSRCLNYLRSLDEQGAAMQVTWHNERVLDVDFRRAKGTVVIGRPDHAADADRAAKFQVRQAIRSYNAHLSRIQVITYSELLDSADRALRFEIRNRAGLAVFPVRAPPRSRLLQGSGELVIAQQSLCPDHMAQAQYMANHRRGGPCTHIR